MTSRKKGIFALIVLSVVWASFGIFIRFFSPYFTSFQQIYLRLFIGGAISLLIFRKDVHFKNLLHAPKKDLLVLLFRIIVFYAIGVVFYIQAFLLTTYADVSLLGAIPTTALLGFILLREKITLQKILLILLSVIGILFITIHDVHHLFSWGRGDMVALIADFFFSLSYIGRKWQTNYFNNKELATYMLVGAFFLIFGLSLFSGEAIPTLTTFTPTITIVLLIVGILNVLSIYFVNIGFANIEAALASNIVSLESFWAVIFGFLIYKEIPSIGTLIGGIFIILSVIL
ncbi:MAG: DMT family transporter, partial [Candidatus Levyibacteriota bacterium]